MRILVLLLACLCTLSVSAEEVLSVQVGVPFKISLPISLPEDAVESLKTYFDALIASRPIPKGYFLESYEINAEKSVVELSGRMIEEGEQTLFLGTFVWGTTIITLPSIKIHVSPLIGEPFSAENLLLPYPESFFHESKENTVLKETFLKQYLQGVKNVLQQQKIFTNGVVFFLFMLCLSPLIFWFLNKKKIQIEHVKKEIPLEEELAGIKESKDWTQLLAFLQKLSKKEEHLTSYELTEVFSKKGNKNLIQAACYIEKYGYLNQSSLERFDEAVDTVSMALSIKSA